MFGMLRAAGRGVVAITAVGLIAAGGWLAAGPAPRQDGVTRAAEPVGQGPGSAVEVISVRLPAAARTKPIEELRVGDRVLGRNPDRDDTDPYAPDPDPSWQVVDIEQTKPSGGRLYASLLRPPGWVAEYVSPGNTVRLEMPHLGAEGPARVVGLRPCPPIAAGGGQVVTGTFRHETDGWLVRVRVAGCPDPIQCTPGHRFWCEGAGAFVRADELHAGDLLRTRAGGLAGVVSADRGYGDRWVYNLEVNGEHVYEVGVSGVLVHNEGCGETYYRTMSKEHFEMLKQTGRMPATKETFISPTKSFSSTYDGVMVKFTVKAGTTEALRAIGVRDQSAIARGAHPSMPGVAKGWGSDHAFFKGEGKQINIGLGRGKALDTFNNNILSFVEVPK